MKSFTDYIPSEASSVFKNWQRELKVEVKLINSSFSRLGVFVPNVSDKGCHVIRIDKDLNKYIFLIVLVHEFAHAAVWEEYQGRVSPHGKEWKNRFKEMMSIFLNNSFFPIEILSKINNHLINPSATLIRDVDLYRSLKQYDSHLYVMVADLNDGDKFMTRNGKRFIRISKIRKNYKCKEISSNQIYHFSPLAEISLI